MNGRVAIGGVKIDDGVSYSAAACWAGVIDNEVQEHAGFPFALSERRTLKGSAKIVMLRGRSGTLRLRLDRTRSELCRAIRRRAICRDRWVKLAADIHIPTASIRTCLTFRASAHPILPYGCPHGAPTVPMRQAVAGFWGCGPGRKAQTPSPDLIPLHSCPMEGATLLVKQLVRDRPFAGAFSPVAVTATHRRLK
jgi:hypothetical protein